MYGMIFNCLFFCAIALNSIDVFALTDNEIQCGRLENPHGPFDYRKASPDQRKLVDNAHFTREVEQLIRGNTSGDPAGDLDYTLRAFPNHPRALRSLMEWGFKKKSDHPKGTNWPVWCYFDRAIRFQPDDAQVKMLYGIYLQRKGNYQESVQQLLNAEKLAGDNANIHYNIGLVYLDLGDYERSLEHAHRAYLLGFPLEGLRNRLKRVGKWKEAGPVENEPKEILQE